MVTLCGPQRCLPHFHLFPPIPTCSYPVPTRSHLGLSAACIISACLRDASSRSSTLRLLYCLAASVKLLPTCGTAGQRGHT